MEALKQIHELTLEEAKKSPCIRRKYGASLFVGDELWGQAHNMRVSKCCNDGCIRDRLDAEHGRSSELGAEIHAEQSLLINKPDDFTVSNIFIAGYSRDNTPLDGKQNWPCYVCARMIKAAGIRMVWVPENGGYKGTKIDEILEELEYVFIDA